MTRWQPDFRRRGAAASADIPLLDVDRLTVNVGSTVPVQQLEFDVSEGEAVALLGPGHTGKAAILDCIGGLRAASSGSVRLNGHRLKQSFTAATFWLVMTSGLLVGLLAAAVAVDVDSLWLAVVKRGLAVDEPFTPATVASRLRSYFRSELAIDPLADHWRIVTPDGREVLAVRRELAEARELRNQLQAAVTARRIGPATVPDLSDLVGDANEPRRLLPLDAATLDRLAGGKRSVRLRGWTALAGGTVLGIAMALAIWQQGRRSPQVAARGGVARTFRQPRIFPAMTVEENVLVAAEQAAASGGWRNWWSSGATDRAADTLKFVGLNGQRQQLAGELSPTEQRLLELARALAIGPRLVLVDEPEAGLTAAEQQSLADLLTAVRQQQVTLLMTASTAGPLTALCDRVIPLDR
ncbi:MAG: ATP-binding cassette domain-containing protein [Planctomycetia bacterium]|nr:ATP-binding cassette domain-containing protein [Planctomycetia bacterium]